MLGEAALMKDLTDQERLMFQTEMGTRRKKPHYGRGARLVSGRVRRSQIAIKLKGLRPGAESAEASESD